MNQMKLYLSKDKIKELNLEVDFVNGEPRLVKLRKRSYFKKGGIKVEEIKKDVVEGKLIASNYSNAKVYQFKVKYRDNKIIFTLQDFIWLVNQDKYDRIPDRCRVEFKEDKLDFSPENLQLVNKFGSPIVDVERKVIFVEVVKVEPNGNKTVYKNICDCARENGLDSNYLGKIVRNQAGASHYYKGNKYYRLGDEPTDENVG